MQLYLESVLSREEHAKEVKLYGLGPRLLERFRDIFTRLYREDRALAIRRDSWGFALGLITTGMLYGAYAWVAVSAARSAITVGAMTMYLLLFRQGQAAVTSALGAVSGMYEDNLYLSTLYEYLDTPVRQVSGNAQAGPRPDDGIRFEDVSFSYPGSQEPALRDVTLHLPPGSSLALVGANGSGKTTLIKLLTRLYAPTAGRILLDGRDLADWDEQALRARIGVIFQDFARYQMTVGENVGRGRRTLLRGRSALARCRDQGQGGRVHRDAARGLRHAARPLVQGWPRAVGRPVAEDRVVARLHAHAGRRAGARRAHLGDGCAGGIGSIRALPAAGEGAHHHSHLAPLLDGAHGRPDLVLDQGRIVERGSHEELLRLDGLYARLFGLQARGYR